MRNGQGFWTFLLTYTDQAIQNLSVMVVSPLEDKCTSLKEEVTGSSDNLAFQQKTWSFTKINLRLLNRTN